MLSSVFGIAIHHIFCLVYFFLDISIQSFAYIIAFSTQNWNCLVSISEQYQALSVHYGHVKGRKHRMPLHSTPYCSCSFSVRRGFDIWRKKELLLKTQSLSASVCFPQTKFEPAYVNQEEKSISSVWGITSWHQFLPSSGPDLMVKSTQTTRLLVKGITWQEQKAAAGRGLLLFITALSSSFSVASMRACSLAH